MHSAYAEEEKPAVDLTCTSRLIAEARSTRSDSPFASSTPLTGIDRDRGRFEQELRGKVGQVSLLLMGQGFTQEGKSPTAKLIANEAYVDFGSGENRYSVGKKILSGDVGYAFRPIDVLQREARMQALPPPLEGVPAAIWERFSADSSWSLIYANPGHGRRGEAKDDEALALRGYRRWQGTDIHGVARISGRYGLEAGAAFSAVPDERLEVHGSFLAQRRGERQIPFAAPISTDTLLAPAALDSVALKLPKKALAGMTWTVENGWSLLGEIWWDGNAPTAADWQRMAEQARSRTALLSMGVPMAAVAGASAAASRLFETPSLNRKGLLGRIAWTDPTGSGWSAALDMLKSPEDGGWTATATVGWTDDRLRLDVGLRRYGGKPDSAYRLLPEKGVVFIGVSIAF